MRWRYAALLLVASFALGNWQLLTGRAIEKWDAYDLATPYYSLLSDFARAGQFLYWNPWVAGGSPDFAIAGSATFSPDFLAFAALTGPGGKGYQVYWLSVWLAGGIGMLLLARHLRAPAWGGLTIALGFVYSGFYTGHAEHVGLLYSYSMLPFIVWRLDVAVTGKRWIPALQAGALWGLTGLSGYPAFTLYTVGLIVLWAAGRCLLRDEQNERAEWKRTLGILVTVGAIGIVVLSPSYISAAYEGRGYSDRSGPVNRSFAINSNALHPAVLITLGSPAYPELKLASKGLFSYTDVSCVSLYTGVATVILALLALCRKEERSWRWFLFIAAIFALCCAMSQALPFRGWIYDFVPPTRYFRHSGMLRGYFLFLLSVLAVYGSRDIAEQNITLQNSRNLFAISSGLSVFGIISYGIVLALANYQKTNWPFALAQLLTVWFGMSLVLLLAYRERTAMRRLLPGAITFLAVLDVFFTSQLADATTIEKAQRPPLRRAASSSVALGPDSFVRERGSGHANVNLLCKLPTLRNYAPFKNEFQEIIAAVPPFAEMALGQDRTWFSRNVPEVVPTGEAFARFANRMWELGAPVLVRHSYSAMLDDTEPNKDLEDIASLPPAIRVPTAVTEYRPEKLVMSVTAPADGWVMVSERWSRSWQLKVNGVLRPLSGGNFVFRAVPVVKGTNDIEFTFHPFAVRPLVFLSWSVLTLITLVSVCTMRRKSGAVPRTRPHLAVPVLTAA